MSTPFPGMNPYLEAPDIRRDFYSALPVYLREQLTPQFPRHIAARLDVRYWYGTAEREKLITIEVFDVCSKSPVTLIEVLSPVYKRPASAGREAYLAKRGKILQSDIHLLEIDLLRAGARLPVIDPLPDAPYFVFLRRGQPRPQCEIWPISLRDPLPVVPVPLLASDAAVQLDLGAALRIVYDHAGYDDWIDYTQPPPNPPFSSEDAAWVETCLRERGLR